MSPLTFIGKFIQFMLLWLLLQLRLWWGMKLKGPPINREEYDL